MDRHQLCNTDKIEMDGGDAIQFTNYFKSLIERPQVMMVELSGE